MLTVENLSVWFETPDGLVAAVREVSLEVAPGECLGIVGESGSGKSQLFLACLGLLAPNGRVTGCARLDGQELIGRSDRELRQVRGARASMVFQDPMSALTPHLQIGAQLTEVLTTHRGLTRLEARARALEALTRVQIPDAERRLGQYPHELSGGMRQRVLIAMAMLCEPELLIADEPTTALDVTVQAQILDLLRELGTHHGTSLVLITHDLGVVAGLADRVAVMYAGRIVEQGPAEALLARPRHPYTQGLLASIPDLGCPVEKLPAGIAGYPPDPIRLPHGCAFAERCMRRVSACETQPPLAPVGERIDAACHDPRVVP